MIKRSLSATVDRVDEAGWVDTYYSTLGEAFPQHQLVGRGSWVVSELWGF